MTRSHKILFIFLSSLLLAVVVPAQSRRNQKGDANLEGSVLSVVATRDDKKTDPIKLESLFLYENGVEQKIKNLVVDPSPSRIVLLVDNSQTLPTPIDKLKQAAMEFAYEIFEGDQIYTIAYDEKPEIIQEWTDDPKKLEASFSTFRKKGNPYLFDALEATLNEVVIPLMPGTRKTAIVVIGDGLDRGSKSTFDKVLGDLQQANVTVYTVALPDRTGGAYRRDEPKPTAVMSRLAEETGGLSFPFDNARDAAKTICDELRKDRYLLSYLPTNTSSYDARRLFLMADQGITIRTKTEQPPNVK